MWWGRGSLGPVPKRCPPLYCDPSKGGSGGHPRAQLGLCGCRIPRCLLQVLQELREMEQALQVAHEDLAAVTEQATAARAEAEDAEAERQRTLLELTQVGGIGTVGRVDSDAPRRSDAARSCDDVFLCQNLARKVFVLSAHTPITLAVRVGYCTPSMLTISVAHPRSGNKMYPQCVCTLSPTDRV